MPRTPSPDPQTLEPLDLTPETEAQWMQLSELALASNQVMVAERCYAALGDIARTRYLHKVGDGGNGLAWLAG